MFQLKNSIRQLGGFADRRITTDACAKILALFTLLSTGKRVQDLFTVVPITRFKIHVYNLNFKLRAGKCWFRHKPNFSRQKPHFLLALYSNNLPHISEPTMPYCVILNPKESKLLQVIRKALSRTGRKTVIEINVSTSRWYARQ